MIQITIYLTFLTLFCCTYNVICISDQQWCGEKWLNDYYLFKWKSYYNEKTIKLRVEVLTKGWVSFGFSKHGRKTEMDLVIGWINDQGQSHLKDFWVNEFGVRSIDVKQDWELLLAEDNATHTVLEFSRNFVTCDPYNDLEIFVNDYEMSNIVFGYSFWEPTDVEDIGGPAFEELTHLSLFYSDDDLKAVETDIQQIDHEFKVKVPNKGNNVLSKNTYCKVFKNPLKEKHQIIKSQPIMHPKESINMQHHIVVYKCPKNIDQVYYAKYHDQMFHCYDPEDPLKRIRFQCQEGILAHSILSDIPVILDSKAGITIDPEQISYYLVELHLLNPTNHESNVSVTLRLSMTKQLRKYEAKQLSFFNTRGDVNKRDNFGFIIPPKQISFKISGTFTGRFYNKDLLETDGLFIFSIIFHSHHAKHMEVRHYRKGEPVRILRYNHYDFQYQPIRRLKSPINFIKDDLIVYYCDVPSMTENKSHTSPHEHCGIPTLAYPMVLKDDCRIIFSRITYKTMLEVTGLEQIDGYETEITDKIIIRKPVHYNNTRLIDFIENNQYKIKDPLELERILNTADVSECCRDWKGNIADQCITVKKPNDFYHSIMKRKQQNSCDPGKTGKNLSSNNSDSLVSYVEGLKFSLKLLAQSFNIYFSLESF